MLQSHYSLFDSFFAPQRILVVSEERLKQAEMEAMQNQLTALDNQIEALNKARQTLSSEIKALSPKRKKKAGKDLDALDGVNEDG